MGDSVDAAGRGGNVENFQDQDQAIRDAALDGGQDVRADDARPEGGGDRPDAGRNDVPDGTDVGERVTLPGEGDGDGGPQLETEGTPLDRLAGEGEQIFTIQPFPLPEPDASVVGSEPETDGAAGARPGADAAVTDDFGAREPAFAPGTSVDALPSWVRDFAPGLVPEDAAPSQLIGPDGETGVGRDGVPESDVVGAAPTFFAANDQRSQAAADILNSELSSGISNVVTERLTREDTAQATLDSLPSLDALAEGSGIERGVLENITAVSMLENADSVEVIGNTLADQGVTGVAELFDTSQALNVPSLTERGIPAVADLLNPNADPTGPSLADQGITGVADLLATPDAASTAAEIVDTPRFEVPENPLDLTLSARELTPQVADPFAEGVLDQIAGGDFSAFNGPAGQLFNAGALAELAPLNIDASQPLGPQIPRVVGEPVVDAALEAGETVARDLLGDAFEPVAAAAYVGYQFATGGELSTDVRIGDDTLSLSGEPFVDFGNFSLDNAGIRDGAAAFNLGDAELGASGEGRFGLDLDNGFTFGGANAEFHALDSVFGGDVNVAGAVSPTFDLAGAATLTDASILGGEVDAGIAANSVEGITGFNVAGENFDVFNTDNAQFSVVGTPGDVSFDASALDIPFVSGGNLDLNASGSSSAGTLNLGAAAQDVQVLGGELDASASLTNFDLTDANVTGTNFDVFGTDNAGFSVDANPTDGVTFDARVSDIPIFSGGNLDLSTDGSITDGVVNIDAGVQDVQVLGGEIDAGVSFDDLSFSEANVSGSGFDILGGEGTFDVGVDAADGVTFDAGVTDIPVFDSGSLDLGVGSGDVSGIDLDAALEVPDIFGGTADLGVDLSTNTSDLLGGDLSIGVSDTNFGVDLGLSDGVGTLSGAADLGPVDLGASINTNGDFGVGLDADINNGLGSLGIDLGSFGGDFGAAATFNLNF